MKQLRSHHLLALALTVLAIVAAGAGCGEDSEGSGNSGGDGGSGNDAPTLPTSSLSEAEYTDRAQAICARGRREALRYQPAAAGESQRDALTKVIKNTLLPSLAKVIDQLRALGAPESEKQRIETMLAAMQKAMDRSEDLNPPTIERIEDLFATSGWLARQAGLVDCVYGDE